MQLISQDKEKRLEYEAREKAIRDYNQFMLEAKQQGREEGLQQGRKEGLQQGREEGCIDIVKNMLALDLPLEIIIKTTGLSESQIHKLNTKNTMI